MQGLANFPTAVVPLINGWAPASVPINNFQGQGHTLGSTGVHAGGSTAPTFGAPQLGGFPTALPPGATTPPQGARPGSTHEPVRHNESREPRLFYTNFDIDSYILEMETFPLAFPTFRLQRDIYQSAGIFTTPQTPLGILGMHSTAYPSLKI